MVVTTTTDKTSIKKCKFCCCFTKPFGVTIRFESSHRDDSNKWSQRKFQWRSNQVIENQYFWILIGMFNLSPRWLLLDMREWVVAENHFQEGIYTKFELTLNVKIWCGRNRYVKLLFLSQIVFYRYKTCHSSGLTYIIWMVTRTQLY